MAEDPTARGMDGGEVAARAAGRDLTVGDLAYLNRMTTVGLVLPNVAHELNNAFQIIGGLVEIVAMRPDLPEDVREKIRRIGGQAARASEMVRELVAFAKRDEAGAPLVDIARLIDRTLTLRRYHLGRARIAVTVDVDEAGPALVRMDANSLQQVVLNLVINAEQALAGRTDGRIGIRVRRNAPRVDVSITDNGTGVGGAVADRLAEPFFTTRGRAAGLGLTVAAALTRASGGDLRLESPADGGTSVVLNLPGVPDA